MGDSPGRSQGGRFEELAYHETKQTIIYGEIGQWASDILSPIQFWLVVWSPLKNMKVNWDDDIPNIWENKPVMFQSPPTRVRITV